MYRHVYQIRKQKCALSGHTKEQHQCIGGLKLPGEQEQYVAMFINQAPLCSSSAEPIVLCLRRAHRPAVLVSEEEACVLASRNARTQGDTTRSVMPSFLKIQCCVKPTMQKLPYVTNIY